LGTRICRAKAVNLKQNFILANYLHLNCFYKNNIKNNPKSVYIVIEKDGNLATGHQRPLNNVLYINVREYRRRNKKMDNPEKLVTYKTRKNKAKTKQNKCWTQPYANKHNKRI